MNQTNDIEFWEWVTLLPVRKFTTHAKSGFTVWWKKHIVLLCKTFLYTCQLYIFRRLSHFALVFDFAATITFIHYVLHFALRQLLHFVEILITFWVSITFCGVTHTYCSKRIKARTILSLSDLSYYFKQFYNFFFLNIFLNASNLVIFATK